jgi:NADH dehydrogenase
MPTMTLRPSHSPGKGPKTALVFGGSGFIGRYLVAALLADGWRVRVASRRPAALIHLRMAAPVGQLELLRAPLQDPEAVARAVEGAAVVVNLVGILAESGRQRFEALHAEGAGRIAEAAAKAGAEAMVQVSAIGADPSSKARYARSKAAGEAAVRAAFPQATILRPSLVIGPEDGFFNRFARMAQISPALPLVDGGRARFQPLVVHDLVAAILGALHQPQAAGQTYELGGPKIYSFKALLEMTLAGLGQKRWLLPLPMPLARLQAAVLQQLPNPPLTLDQLLMLERDTLADERLPGFADLGIQAQAIEPTVTKILAAYRRPSQPPRPTARPHA